MAFRATNDEEAEQFSGSNERVDARIWDPLFVVSGIDKRTSPSSLERPLRESESAIGRRRVRPSAASCSS